MGGRPVVEAGCQLNLEWGSGGLRLGATSVSPTAVAEQLKQQAGHPEI